MVIIPWGVELDDDEVVLADSFGEVWAVQGEHELLRFRFRFLGTDPCQRRREETHSEHHKANRNPRRHFPYSESLFVCGFLVLWAWVSLGGVLTLWEWRENETNMACEHVSGLWDFFLLRLAETSVTNVLVTHMVYLPTWRNSIGFVSSHVSKFGKQCFIWERKATHNYFFTLNFSRDF